MSLKVTQGVRKNSVLFLGPDGHTYYFNKSMKGTRASLECVLRKKRNVWCRGRASVDQSGGGFKSTQRHTYHDRKHFLRQQFRFAVLSRCRKGDFTSLRQIYNEERRKLSPEIGRSVCADLPFVTLRSAMARARKMSLPGLPKTIPEFAEMLASEDYNHLGKTLDEEDHVYAASGGCQENKTAFLILASGRMLDELARAKKVFSDATFCSPAGMECRQVWNLVKLRQHHIIPMARVLMQSKSQVTYELVIEKLKELRPAFKPHEIMCDFEDAQKSAWQRHFPDARIHGCLFHSSKSIAGKAKELKLKRLISTNHSANSISRSMCGLAFLPSHTIKPGLKKLERRSKAEHVWTKLKPLFDYFKSYWLRRVEMLSVYGCPDRTNNACESDNRTLRALVKYKHPSVFCFLRGALESEDDAVQDIEVLNIPRKASRKRRSSVLANDAKVKDLVEGLRNRDFTCIDFLRKISRNVQTSYNRGLGFDDGFG